MATTKSIVTRIKNKVDTLAAWQSYTGTLLDGEIAIVRVATGETYLNPVTNQDEPVVELLMKVGDGSTPFAQLPWLSAKASDVYGWAKLQNASDVEVQYNSGTEAAPSFIKASLAEVLKGVKDNAAGISALGTSKLADITVTSTGSGVVKSVAKNGVGGVKATLGTVGTDEIASDAVTNAKLANGAVKNAEVASDAAIDATKLYYATDKVTVAAKLATLSGSVASLQGNVLSALTVTPTDATANGVVQGIAYNSTTGKFTVTYGTVATGDIADSAVTTDKIKDGDVTDAKIAKVSASKVEVTPKTTVDGKEVAAVMLPAKLGTIDSELSRIEGKLDNFTASGVRFIGKVKAAPTASSNAVTIDDGTTNGKSATAKLGDIVLYNNIEHICVATTGSARWQVLGDQSQIGTLTTLTGSLHASARTTNKYVTHIKKDTDGKLKVQYAQPTVNEVLAATSDDTDKTLAEKLAEVDAAIASKSDSTHTHAAYVNKNAFGNIKVIKSGGGTTATDVTVAADTTTDTVEFEGSNVTITGTKGSGSTADKITFAVAAGTTSVKGIVQLSDATDIPTNKTGSETAATTKAVAAAMEAAEEADAKAAEALEAAGHDHPYAADDHGHGKIDKDGKITGTALSSASGLLAYDSNGLIQKVTAAAARTAIGAGTSSLTIGTSATTAAAGNHTHSSYTTDIANIHSSYARIGTVGSGTDAKNYLYNGKDGTYILIFDCGGASDI